MPAANRMDALLNKIERRLGTRPLNLPDFLKKDKWAEEVISNETLDTFSRYFPNQITVHLQTSKRRKDGWYVIDDEIPDNVVILGIKDIDWKLFSRDTLSLHEAQGYGVYDFMTNTYGMDDIALLQMRQDHLSMFNNQVFVEYRPPNLVKISTVTGADISRGMKGFPIDVLVKHSSNLMTISPTMMETFEDLAQADVATFLYQNLKYYDGLETVYANIELKMGDLEAASGKREDVLGVLKDSYVSASNSNQPLMFTV